MLPNHDLKMSPVQVSAALGIGTIAVLMVGVQPILLGELVEARQVSLEGVGIVAMAEIIMLGLGVVLGDALLSGAWLRLVTVAAALGTACLDLLTLQATGDAAMTGVRAAAGLVEGLLIWGTTGVVVRTANPARVGGVFFITQTLAQALLSAVLANVIIPHRGWQGGFVALGLLALLPCLLAFLQPRRLSPLAPPAVSGFRWSVATLLPLSIVFLQLATLGSFWAYLEPLGKAAGFDARAAQTLLAVVTISIHQLPGGSTQNFALACALFGFVWLFMLPFHIGLAFRADPSGRLAGLVPAAQLLGSAFGPLTASFIVEGENVAAVPLLSAGFAIAGAVLVLVAQPHRDTLRARALQ